MIVKLLSLYLFIGILFLTFMFVYSFMRGKSSYSRVLGILSLSLQIYLLGYLLELNAASLEEMFFWNQIQYFGIPFFPVLWLMVSMLYTGNGAYMKGWRSLALFAVPITTFVIRLTNGSHHLYYSQVELKVFDQIQLMLLIKGPWYLVQMAYVLFALVLCSWFYFKRYRGSIGEERIQFRLLLIASILPYLSLVLGTFNFGNLGIDYTALILPPCVFLINVALTQYNFLDIKSLAWERIFQHSETGMLLMNKTLQILDYNPACSQYFLWFGVQLKKEYVSELLRDQPKLLKGILDGDDDIYTQQIEGETRFFSLKTNSVHNNKAVVGYLMTIEDVTEREMMKGKLIEMANTDELSGLKNRRSFNEYAKAYFERALRYGDTLTILMMDIDHFKKINDVYGHHVGDQVIKAFAGTLQRIFRGTDVIGRMGGEEFAVIMINTTPEQGLEKAEQFRIEIAKEPIQIEGQAVSVTVSIGIAELDTKSQTIDQVINHADQALYEAKMGGRNQTAKYNLNS